MFSQDIPERTSYPSAYTHQITDGQVDYRKKIKMNDPQNIFKVSLVFVYYW
jgi:hypothetical protein